MRKLIFIALLGIIALPLIAPAIPARSATFTYAAWMPYWKKTTGIPDAEAHLSQLGEINPFSYEVAADGTIKDAMKIGEEPWASFLAHAREKKVKIVPTILWAKGDEIHSTLSSKEKRAAHVAAIAALVQANNFDGIDIDYEGKLTGTIDYFSAFIKELSLKLKENKKILACTVEARTPAASRFVSVPKDIAYANDYAVLGKYCDQFRIMAYDQKNIDLKLNKSKGANDLYAPIADAAWVEKVIRETMKTVPKAKIILGIPTYGYEYLAKDENPYRVYTRVRAITYKDAAALATSTGQAFMRNSAGEVSFAYYKASTSTASGSTRYVSMSDAKAIEQKIKLAKKMGLGGVVIFRIDGESDPLIWSKLK
jgi:spore germination protein YaaH